MTGLDGQRGSAWLSDTAGFPGRRVTVPGTRPLSAAQLADRIRTAISAAGITQEDAARAAGMDPTALSKALAGKRRFTAFDIAQICNALGLSPLALLDDGTPPPSPGTADVSRVCRLAELDRLLTDVGYPPSRDHRYPVTILDRAIEAWLAGHISIRPAAGITGVDAGYLLEETQRYRRQPVSELPPPGAAGETVTWPAMHTAGGGSGRFQARRDQAGTLQVTVADPVLEISGHLLAELHVGGIPEISVTCRAGRRHPFGDIITITAGERAITYVVLRLTSKDPPVWQIRQKGIPVPEGGEEVNAKEQGHEEQGQ